MTIKSFLTLLVICLAHTGNSLKAHDESGNSLPDDRLQPVQDYLETLLVDSRPKDYAKVMYYLNKEIQDQEYVYRTVLDHLFVTISSNKPQSSIEEYANKVILDVNDRDFLKIMNEVYELKLSSRAIVPGTPEWEEHFDQEETYGNDKLENYVKIIASMLITADSMPEIKWDGLKQELESENAGSNMVVPFKQGRTELLRAERNTALSTVKLIATQLSWNTVHNIYQWWNEEITGTRCAKNIIQEWVAASVGFFGTYIGDIVGSRLGKPQLASLAGHFTYYNTYDLMDKMLLEYFDLPKEAAVENAYKFLGVKQGASNAEINDVYGKLARRYYPTWKGGDEEKFMELRLSMELIRKHRKDKEDNKAL